MKTFVKDDEILSIVINNFKNPTIAQIKALELFLNTSSGKISSEEKDLIELTLNSCNYMHKMIDNFSFIVKLNSEKISLDYKTFDILELIKTVLKEISILLKYSNLKLNINSAENTVITADEAKIKNALESLLLYSASSALKNSSIDISILNRKNMMEIEISSNCLYEYENLFEGSQIKNSSLQNIALITSKEIINAHFGRMIYKNFENNKMTIGFGLPNR